MKQKILLVCICLLITSCSVKTYYQIVDVKSSNVQKESNNYVYNDGDCKIIYNFWKEGGDAGFTIENLSDEIIYIDLGNTFYIENGKAYDYFKDRSYGTGKESRIIKGKAMSATAYGTWNIWPLNGYLGSTSSQASSSISTGSSSSIVYSEKPIESIPPHASKSFSEYKIMTDVIQDCSIKMMVKKAQPEGKTFSESESPINFRNYITYRKGESIAAKIVTNDFYIGGFTNYFSSDELKAKKHGCKQSLTKTHHKEYAPDRFFVKYDKKHSNHYSADANAAITTENTKTSKNKETKKGYSYW